MWQLQVHEQSTGQHLYTLQMMNVIGPIVSSRRVCVPVSGDDKMKYRGQRIGRRRQGPDFLGSSALKTELSTCNKLSKAAKVSRKSGRSSFHLFMEESSSETTRDSHSFPMRPMSILDFFVAYRVLCAYPSISASLINQMKQDILHGFPGGC